MHRFLLLNMKTEDIIKHLKLQDSNIDFYKREVKRLEQQISDIKSISNVSNTVGLDLSRSEYSKEEIINAYNKMLKYEGIKEDRVGGLIIDTFIEFLNGTHHSLNGA
jgi:hypothetical protein